MNIELHGAIGDRDDVLAAAFGSIKCADLHGGVSADIDRRGVGEIEARKRLLAGDGKRIVGKNELACDVFGGRTQPVADLALDPLQGFVLRRAGRIGYERGQETERQNACRTITKGRGTYATRRHQ